MKKKYFKVVTIIAIGMLFLGIGELYAQQTIIIRGKVSDAKGEVLPGVTVVEKDNDNRILNGTATDVNGSYQIEVSIKTDSLHFSQIGMKKVAKAIKGNTVIDVVLQDDIYTFEEVEITAKRSNSTGGFFTPRDQTAAVTTILMETLENIPAVSLDQVLEGQVPGLMISMSSGDPGSGSSIQIRGASSLGMGTRPLIVVDNVPFKTEEIIDVDNPQGLSELLNISVSDIESVSILKDAAATSLWGSDGANGVIVVTTKRGDNVRPRVSVNTQWGIKLPQSPLPLLNGDQYKTMILEAYQNRYGVGLDIQTSPIRNLFLEKGALDYENYNNNTSWPDQINMKRGFVQDYSASIIGGGESAKYNVSLGYHDEVGPVMETGFNRMNGRFNFDYTISNRLNVNSDISYSSGKKKSSYSGVGDIAIQKAPVLPIYSQDEYGNDLPSYFFPGTNGFQGNMQNPVAISKLAEAMDYTDRLDAKVQIRYSSPQGLQVNGLISASYEAMERDRFLPHSATGDDFYAENFLKLFINGNVNKAGLEDKNAFTLYAKNDIIYRMQFAEKHDLVAGLYTTYQDISTKLISLEGTNLPAENITNPFRSDILNRISSTPTLVRDFSSILQLFYSYGRTYALTGSMRRQGNSSFGRNNRWGYFPAVSGFWRPIAEPFLTEPLKFLDEFKIRGSYGITGRSPNVNDAAVKNSYFTYSSNSPFIDFMGVTPDNIQLKGLKWERTTQENIGLDLALFKNRLNFAGDIAFLTTRDLIINAPISTTSGYENMTQNFGSIRGRSYEAAITGRPILSKKWELNISFNISKSNSKVIELPGGNPVIRDNTLDNGKFLSLINVGNEIGTIYGLKFLGVYSTDGDAFVKDAQGNYITNIKGEQVPIRWLRYDGEAFSGGDAIYEDLNNDGIIDKRDVTVIGNNNPDFYGGFWIRLKYNKAWELFANFTYQSGFDVINESKMNTTNMYSNNNQTQAVLRRWRKQGDITDVPRALYGAGHNWVGSDRYIEDGSYIKFTNLTFSYTMPQQLLNKLSMRGARVGLTVSNLGIVTNYSGVDPSISMNRNDPFQLGRDRNLTPIPITYTLQLWLNF